MILQVDSVHRVLHEGEDVLNSCLYFLLVSFRLDLLHHMLIVMISFLMLPVENIHPREVIHIGKYSIDNIGILRHGGGVLYPAKSNGSMVTPLSIMFLLFMIPPGTLMYFRPFAPSTSETGSNSRTSKRTSLSTNPRVFSLSDNSMLYNRVFMTWV
jgi:hypothetical protein